MKNDESSTKRTEDLSEKEIRAALQESRDRFQTLFKTMPMGVVYQTADGKIEMVNQAACDILGLTVDELMGRTSMDPRWRTEDEYGQPLSGDQHPAMVALRTGNPVNDFLLSLFSPRHPNRRWLLINAVPEFREGEDKPFRVYAAFADVTDRREALLALTQSEQRYRTLISSTPVGVHLWKLNESGKLIFTGANPAADRILGIDNSQFIGMELLEAFPANADTEIPQRYIELCNGAPPWHTEQYSYIDDKITGIFDVHAFQTGPGSMAAFFQDITDRKLAESDREKLIRDLQSKQEELESFTYAVSHDLKSPLITTHGFLSMAHQDLKNGDLVNLRSDLQRIENATEKMFQLLDDLLKLSRLGRSESSPENVDVNELIGEVLELMAGPIQNNGVEVVVDPNLPSVTADRSKLHSVFQNLVENAIKFGPEDATTHIEIGATLRENTPTFFVRDNGIGIEPRHQGGIFNIFSKLDSSKPGSGMGLALVSRIVEHHGGKVWVESDGEGTGTCFFFNLPGHS